jgi:hypothetical protein
MKNLFIAFVSFFFLNICKAQTICKALNGMAYVTTSLPGMMPVDENGLPRKVEAIKTRTIYLVTSCDEMPQITSIKYGITKATFSITKDPKYSLLAGINLKGEKVIMCEATDNFLWKVDLDAASLKNLKSSNQKILIEGKIKKKAFKLTIKKEIALEGIPTY